MYEFWSDYVRLKYREKYKIVLFGYRPFHCIHKKKDVYKDIAEGVETRFDTSNYKLERPLPKGKNGKVVGLMKDELGGKLSQNLVD